MNSEECTTAVTLSGVVRPVITVGLTIVFAFLVVWPLLSPYDETPTWTLIFPAFMGVYGGLIGFWFGERSALKVPGQQPEPPNPTQGGTTP